MASCDRKLNLSWASAELLPPQVSRFHQVFADVQKSFEITARASSSFRKNYTLPCRRITNVEILVGDFFSIA
jgi:hypothetical protein